MKKIISVFLLSSLLILSTFPASAQNVMSYFKTVHIIEREKDTTPKEMFLIVKEAAEKQLEGEKQLNVVSKNNNVNNNISSIVISGVSTFEYLRSR